MALVNGDQMPYFFPDKKVLPKAALTRFDRLGRVPFHRDLSGWRSSGAG
jgi:hypothetical protein